MILVLSLLLAAAGVAYVLRSVPEPPVQDAEVPVLMPISEVWPEALVTVPRKLENGRSVTPLAMLSTHAVLLMTAGRRPEFLSFDARTGRHHVLATAPKRAACEECFDTRRTAVNAKQIAFLVAGKISDWERRFELWTMPRAGGPLRMVARLPADAADYYHGFQITDDLAVWWGLRGVWQVPLTGGEPEQVLSDEYTDVTTWPWGYDRRRQSVVDLYTNREDRALHVHDLQGQNCGPVWCVGQVDTELHELTKTAIQRVDGSGRTTVPGIPVVHLGPIQDRFVLLGAPAVVGESVRIDRFQLYDRCTRQAALLGSPKPAGAAPSKILQGATTPDRTFFFWKDSGTRYTVLDLSRVAGGPCG